MIKRTRKPLLFWAISMLISFALPAIGYRIGKAGDCTAGQIDGQCGLTTAVWLAFGVIGAVVIAICCTAYLIIAILRQRRASTVSRNVRGG
jgi:hypothetical protein